MNKFVLVFIVCLFGFSSGFFFGDEKMKPCLPKVYQTDLGVISSLSPVSGVGRFYLDTEKEVGRVDLKLRSGVSETRNVSFIYRLEEGKVYVVLDSKFCESFSISKEVIIPRCLERTSKKNTILLGSNTRCDVWELKRDVTTMKLVIDQKKTEEGEYVPINLITSSRYHGIFFHEFFNFQKKQRLGGDLFELPDICKRGDHFSHHEHHWDVFIHLDFFNPKNN